MKATTFFDDPDVLARVSRGLGEPMVGINVEEIAEPHPTSSTRLVAIPPVMAIEKILDLEQLEVNIYRGRVQPGIGLPATNIRRARRGPVPGVGGAHGRTRLRSAFPARIFLRPGDAKAPTVFLVERLRDGGSFCTRRVSAVQHGRTIFSMSASFQTEQDGIEHQDLMPPAPPPDDLPGFVSKGGVFDDAGFAQFAEWDVRLVPQDSITLLPGKASQQQVWFRHREPLPDDHVLHICALAYMSDLTLLGSAQVHHSEERKHLMVASLDHAMVHAPVPGRRMAAVRPELAVIMRAVR